MYSRSIIFAVLSLITLGQMSVYALDPDSEISRSEISIIQRRVQTTPARSASAWSALTAPAIVSVAPQATWRIAPPHEGVLTRWVVSVGERVKRGDTLAAVSLYSIADLTARLKAAQRVSRARAKRVTSIQRQVRSGARAQEALDEAQAALDEAHAAVDAASLALRARTRSGSKRTEWRAEVSGTITSILCAPGSALDPHEPCVTLIDTDQRVISLRAPMLTLAQLEVGQPAQWTASERARRDVFTRPLPLVLRMIIPPQARGESLGEAIFTLRDEQRDEQHHTGELPMIGVSGSLTVTRSAPERAVWVPRSALTEWGGAHRVFVRRGGHPVAITVELIGGFEGGVVIRAPALKEGDLVVTRGVFSLKSEALLSEEE